MIWINYTPGAFPFVITGVRRAFERIVFELLEDKTVARWGMVAAARR